jgi:hypothetical protein
MTENENEMRKAAEKRRKAAARRARKAATEATGREAMLNRHNLFVERLQVVLDEATPDAEDQVGVEFAHLHQVALEIAQAVMVALHEDEAARLLKITALSFQATAVAMFDESHVGGGREPFTEMATGISVLNLLGKAMAAAE